MADGRNWNEWEAQVRAFAIEAMRAGDPAHDAEHIGRVVSNARMLAEAEQADLAVVLPAAWLHDCVVVPKDSPERSRASRLAGEQAVAFLRSIGYSEALLPAIQHAIEAHSFSAGIAPRTVEARVVQDADRLDSLGAVGLARCLILSASLGRRLYDPADPFAEQRALDDQVNTIDHFYVKLLKLPGQMQTAAGRRLAQERSLILRTFLKQLRAEIPPPGTGQADNHD